MNNFRTFQINNCKSRSENMFRYFKNIYHIQNLTFLCFIFHSRMQKCEDKYLSDTKLLEVLMHHLVLLPEYKRNK